MRIGVIATILVFATSLACAAADDPKVSLDAKDMAISEVMADLGKQADVQIVCDSGVKGTVTGQFASIELEKLLDAITKPNDLKWQKLYLPAPAGGEKPTLEQVKARAEAVAAVTGGPIVICDPATGKQKVFVEQDPASPSIDPEKLGLKPVYLVSKPDTEASTQDAAKGADAAKRFASLQTERLNLLANMSPEQRVAAMQMEMIQMLQMDPATRQQMMMDQMRARHDLDPQTREMLHQTMRDTWRSMRDQGLIPDDGHRRGRDHGNG